YIHAEVRGAFMKGEWVVTTKENYRIPFTAQAGQAFRFTSLTEAPVGDLSGEWAALFDIASDEPYKAIGEFKQQQNRLTGTFRTETGDYRYLEGTVQGRKFWLSCFDGTHAFLFSGSMRGDSLQGEFRSGKSAGELWTAWRDPNFRLGAADSLVTLKAGVAGITFRDTTPEGRILAFPGPDYAGKVKIFTILGTWCPNCRDEQLFLSEYLRRHPEQAAQMAVVGFAFERHKTAAEANAHLSAYKQKLGIPFDIVHAGKNNKDVAAAYFPSLSRVMAFPTMIVLDKRNQVRRIHTGFDGPATSKYAEFEQEFGRLIGALIEEK
ncbi:MAG TPA: TlpA disulfide reductase family protein, partial [Saprospiraceae bacterium]|nr:TlpA disulfide reductase family protein [Saprospiraceae bacterium]